MEDLHIDGHVAGAKTLWIIQFPSVNVQKDQSDPFSNKYNVQFLIPTPLKSNEWKIVANEPENVWLKTFLQFQELCEEAKSRCKQQIENSNVPLEEKTKEVGKEISNFASLLHYFNELMKLFKPPESPPEKKAEEQ